MLNHSSVREARIARAAQDADQDRRFLEEAYRRDVRDQTRRMEKRMEKTMEALRRDAIAAQLYHEALARTLPIPIVPAVRSPSPSHHPPTPPTDQHVRPTTSLHPSSPHLCAFIDTVPLSKVVTSAIIGQLHTDGESGLAAFRALTRPQLELILRASQMEGLGPALWIALLKSRFEEGEQLSRDELAQIQRPQGGPHL